MKLYFDQNAIQYIIERTPLRDLKNKFTSKKIQPCLSIDNMYEFGRCFLDEASLENIKKGKEIFNYLFELDIDCIINDTGQLIGFDLEYARTGGKILPYLYGYELTAVKEEIARLSKGFYDRAKKFISDREAEISRDNLLYRSTIVKANIGKGKPSDFQKMRDNWGYRRQILNGSKYQKKAKILSNSTLFSKPERYPFLNTYINEQIYLNFIALANPQGPSKKLTPDYRHLINANAADCLVTEDERIQKNSQLICPYIKILTWEQFKKIL